MKINVPMALQGGKLHEIYLCMLPTVTFPNFLNDEGKCFEEMDEKVMIYAAYALMVALLH